MKFTAVTRRRFHWGAALVALAFAGLAPTAPVARADVFLDIKKTYTAVPGGAVNITVDLTNTSSLDIAGISLALSYDSSVFTISNVQAGSLLSGGLATNLAFNASTAGLLTMSTFTVNPQTVGAGSGAVLSFTLTNTGSTPPSSVINLMANSGGTITSVDTLTGGVTLNPAPTNGSGDAVDGLVTFSAIPEPSQYAMAGLLAGLGGLNHAWNRRRRARTTA